MRATFNVGKNKAQSITPKKGPNTTRQCFTSHHCSMTAFSSLRPSLLRDLKPEVLQNFPIPPLLR